MLAASSAFGETCGFFPLAVDSPRTRTVWHLAYGKGYSAGSVMA
jgi:hypothetical protein